MRGARLLPSSLAWMFVLSACATSNETAELVAPSEVADEAIALRSAGLAPARFLDPRRREKLATAFPKIDALIGEFAEQDEIPGVAVGVVIDGELAHVSTVGVADLDRGQAVDASTVFRIGSITKVFTATALLQLREAGELDFDEPVARALPELEGLVYPFGDGGPIDYADLLTHSSGLPRLGRTIYWEEQAPSADELRASLDGLALDRAPGTSYEYSNFGFALLGLALEGISGEPARVRIDEGLLAPLGMDATVWELAEIPEQHRAAAHERDEQGALTTRALWAMGPHESAGGLAASVEDLARFAAWQLDAWPPREAEADDPGEALLSRASRREAQTIQFATGGDRYGPRGVGWAWHIGHDCALGKQVSHSGGTDGFASKLTLLPHRGVAVIVLTNAQHARPSDYSEAILAALEQTGGLARRVPVPSPELEALAGRVADLIASWSDDDFAALAAPVYALEHPAEVIAEEFAWWHERLGACELDPQPAHVHAIDHAGYRLRCEQGEATLTLRASLGQPTLWLGYRLRSDAVPPDPQLEARARGVAALTKVWSDEGFDQTFAGRWDREQTREFLTRVREQRGACVLGKPLSVTGPRSASFALLCARELMRVDLAIGDTGDDADKVTLMRIQPRYPGPRCED